MLRTITGLAVIIGVLLLVLSVTAKNRPNTFEHSLDVQEETYAVEYEDFDRMMDVLTHQRCLNCHPSDNVPKQGDNAHPHYFGMKRGENDKGFEATSCTTCHQSENNAYSGVPGAPHWSLAPASMGWEGLSRIEIAKKLLDKTNNGNRTHEELITHLTEDELVLWAWDPGVDANGKERTPPPVSKERFKEAVIRWFENGAIIPSE